MDVIPYGEHSSFVGKEVRIKECRRIICPWWCGYRGVHGKVGMIMSHHRLPWVDVQMRDYTTVAVLFPDAPFVPVLERSRYHYIGVDMIELVQEEVQA